MNTPFSLAVEKLANQINEGNIHEILELKLDDAVLEQAQFLAELLNNGHKLVDNVDNIPQGTNSPPSKRLRTDKREESQNLLLNTTGKTVADRVDNSSSPCHYFLSSISDIPETGSQLESLTFEDILDPSLGLLKESVQFNFMVELGWLLSKYCRHKIQ